MVLIPLGSLVVVLMVCVWLCARFRLGWAVALGAFDWTWWGLIDVEVYRISRFSWTPDDRVRLSSWS